MAKMALSYQFGEWLVEPQLGVVRNGTEVRKLEPKAMDVLTLLLEQAGKVVSSGEILDTVWAGRIVEEGAVHQKVSQIRAALGDNPHEPRYIESIPKRGYRTVAALALCADSASPPGIGIHTPARRGLRAAVLSAILVAVVVAAIGLLGRREDPESRPKAIAVLPFANMSADPAQQHFADGLTDELLTSLATIDELRVISRTSSFAVDRGRPLREIAATLGVSHVLEGGVRRAGDRIRITAQLIDASSDSHVWSASYDRELTLEGILQIQKEIALAVVDALQLKLFRQSSRPLDSDGPASLAALDLYHEAMFYVRQIEIGQYSYPTTFERAVEKLQASISADPSWAPPHAALGQVYHFWKDWGDGAAKLRTSKRHIMDALRLQRDYGPAYRSLGYILTVQGDYTGAMRAYDRSVSLGTDSSWGKAILLTVLARYAEAIEAFRKALAQDPLSVVLRAQLVNANYCAGRYAETIDGSEALLSITPDHEYSTIRLAIAHVRTGNLKKGLELADALAERMDTEAPLALLFALAGQEERARAALNALVSNDPGLAPGALVDAAVPAAIVLGEEDRALTMLEHLTTDTSSDPLRSFNVLHAMRCYPEVRSLAGNPRYDALLDRLGLPT